MDTETVETSQVICEKCGKPCKGSLGLAIHMSRGHNIKPKAKKRTRKAAATPDVENNGHAAGKLTAKRMHEAMLAEGRQENISGLIGLMFPNGIPAKKIEPLMDWIDQTRELMS